MASFSEMPVPVKATVFVAGGGSVLGAAAMVASGSRSPWVIVGLALVVCALVLLLYLTVLLIQRRKKADSFGKDIDAGTLRSGSAGDPNKAAEIDLLRKRFLEGKNKYEQEGYKLYDMPWFLIMGEPGSGKTFALRKSSIGFLPGLQNELQGGGGTLTMDWWFTRDAVLLDTAGRFAMEDDQTGERQHSELAALLGLLKKHRRNCPVNGMILVIPAESLLGDSADAIETKAKKLANTIHRVQRELDVRFPVIVWVTKCDMVPGFRAYFDSIANPERQHQMVGWSNPDELDTPFRPDQVGRHMAAVIEDFRERRWSLLEAQEVRGQARRIDAVDSLYAFPDNFSRLMSSLERYLEFIFVGSKKPPFLRGIYFNSAITEGGELDKQIAEGMGISVKELKERNSGGAYARDKAFFIRDSLAKKLFVEKNLVTRESNAMSSLRRSQWLMGAGIVAGLLAMVVWAWFSHEQLRKDIDAQTQHWQYLARYLGSPQIIQLVAPTDKGGYIYRGAREMSGEGLPAPTNTFLGFYANLANFASQDIHVSPLFRIFPTSLSSAADRQNAWRIAFKTAILEPVVGNTGRKLQSLQRWELKPEEDALLALFWWEGVLDQGKEFSAQTFVENGPPGGVFLDPMIRFLSGANLPAGQEKRLDQLLQSALDKDPARPALAKFPGLKFDEILDPPSGPVATALSVFLNSAKTKVEEIEKKANSYSKVVDSLEPLRDDEMNWLQFASADAASADYYVSLTKIYATYLKSYQTASDDYARIAGPGQKGGEVAPVLKEYVTSGQSEIALPFAALTEGLVALDRKLPAHDLYQKAKTKIGATLSNSMTTLSGNIEKLIRDSQPYDNDYLKRLDPDGVTRMEARFQLYQDTLRLFKTAKLNWEVNHDNPLFAFVLDKSRIEKSLSDWPSRPGRLRTPDNSVPPAMRKLAAKAEAYQRNFQAREYASYCNNYLAQNLAFPFITNGNRSLPLALVIQIEGRLKALAGLGEVIFGTNAPEIATIVGRLRVHADTGRGLTDAASNDKSRAMKLEIPSRDDPNTQKGNYLENGEKFAGDKFRWLRINRNTESAVDAAIPTKSWEVRLDEPGFLLECSEEGKNDWQILKRFDGPWSPLRFVLENGRPLAEERDGYKVKLRAADGTFFVLKVSFPGGLPHKPAEWPGN